ncbi:MAG: hypothetical protein F2734_02775, partial [Actinobacteria bacterium]|nr:hypothetical protein [Actinomycetota bacterium]
MQVFRSRSATFFHHASNYSVDARYFLPNSLRFNGNKSLNLEESVSNQIVRVGVIGAGAVASSVHLPILTRRSDLFAVAAIADFNIAAAHLLADRFGIVNRFPAPEEMFASSLIDAVVILNSGSHAEVVVKALNSGLDVFCEKPLAYTREEMKSIEVALSASGKKLMIGYMKTFDPAVTAAKKLIKSRPRTVDVVVLHPSGESQLATTEI